MPETTFQEMMYAIRDSLGNFASSDDEQDGENEEDDKEDTELGKLSDDNEHGCEMGIISKTVQHRMESVQQKKMRLHKLMHPGWLDGGNSF